MHRIKTKAVSYQNLQVPGDLALNPLNVSAITLLDPLHQPPRFTHSLLTVPSAPLPSGISH